MDLNNIINNYVEQHKIISKYHLLFYSGYMLSEKINKMGNAKVMKPSYFEVDKTITSCTKYKEQLIKSIYSEIYIDDRKLIESEIIKLENTQINTLTDCKTFAALICTMGLKLEKKVGPLFTPLFVIGTFTITTGDFFFLFILSLIIGSIIQFT